MPKGIFSRLIADQGFGFINTGWGEDLFSRRNELQGVDKNSLRERQQVEYEVAQALDGYYAVKVRLSQGVDNMMGKPSIRVPEFWLQFKREKVI